jgi:DNA-binding transcriptional ArsR family regulator
MKRKFGILFICVIIFSLIAQSVWVLGLSEGPSPKYTKKNISGNQFKGTYDANDGITQYNFANRMMFNFSSDSNVSLDVNLDTALSDYYFSAIVKRASTSTAMPIYKMNTIKDYSHPAQGKAGRWRNNPRNGPNSGQNQPTQQEPESVSISPYRQIYFIIEIENIQELIYSFSLDNQDYESLAWAYYDSDTLAWYVLDSTLNDGWLITSINTEETPDLIEKDQIILAPVVVEPETSPIFQFLKDNWIYLLIGAICIIFVLIMSNQEYREYLLNRLPIANKGVHKHLEMEDVLENEVRSKIIELILENPGIHFNEILRYLDISAGQLAWHLDVLETFHVIRKMRVGQYLTYFPYLEQNPISKIDLHLAKSKTTLEILQIINDNPGIYQGQIAKRLDLNHKTVKYHIDKLIEVGAVRIDDSKSKKGLYPIIIRDTE